jgi:hypothetical protein
MPAFNTVVSFTLFGWLLLFVVFALKNKDVRVAWSFPFIVLVGDSKWVLSDLGLNSSLPTDGLPILLHTFISNALSSSSLLSFLYSLGIKGVFGGFWYFPELLLFSSLSVAGFFCHDSVNEMIDLRFVLPLLLLEHSWREVSDVIRM